MNSNPPPITKDTLLDLKDVIDDAMIGPLGLSKEHKPEYILVLIPRNKDEHPIYFYRTIDDSNRARAIQALKNVTSHFQRGLAHKEY